MATICFCSKCLPVNIMAPRRGLPRGKTSFNSWGKFTAGDLQQIQQLLPLLRSGGLDSFLEETKPTKPKQSSSTKSLDLQTQSRLQPTSDWQTVKKQKTEKIENLAKDILVPEGWSAPVVKDMGQMIVNSPGVCLASVLTVRKALGEFKSQMPLAALAPVNVDEKGQIIHVFVTD